jgi:hypothetical protein
VPGFFYLGVRLTSAPAGATWLYRLPDRLITIRDRLKLFRGQMESLFRASHLERQPVAAIINLGELEIVD